VLDGMLSCVAPAGGPAGSVAEPSQSTDTREVRMPVARVGSQAPGFTGNAYYQGEFKQVSLSDYAGKWVMLCFYPGDFTFV
jgi:peroxiredoxin (alkyl hydroperoxide reductase subunit C)